MLHSIIESMDDVDPAHRDDMLPIFLWVYEFKVCANEFKLDYMFIYGFPQSFQS